MKAKIISVINQKGGVGKSSISVNLSYELSLVKKVLLIDLDPQAHSTCIYNDKVIEEATIAEAFLNRKINIKALISKGKINSKVVKNLDIIPSSIRLASSVDQINSLLYREQILFNHLKTIERDYDYVIIDCPPTLGVLSINAIYAGSSILIPTNYGRYSLEGMADLLDVVREIKQGAAHKLLIVRNFMEKRNIYTNNYIQSQLNYLQGYLLNTIIMKSESINHSQIALLPVHVFNNSSRGAEDFRNLAKEIEICA